MFVILVVLQLFLATRASSFHERICRDGSANVRTAISTIVDEMREKSVCMVSITDDHHRDYLGAKRTDGAGITPEYAIAIRDDEEFAPARNRVKATLSSSKLAGCDGYAILIANGLRAAQLLQYVERERLVNMQGRFLLLHDRRLFAPPLEYIWNRMINVLFVRRYDVNDRESNDGRNGETIVLETVYYPPRKKRFLLTKYINTWQNGRYRYADDHFKHKTTDLAGKSLKVAVFEHIPAVTEASRGHYEGNYTHNNEALGIEFELMRIIAKALNFKASFYAPPGIDAERWGNDDDDDENGSYTGLIGEAVTGKAAFLLGDLHYTLRHLEFLDLTIPYNTECLTFLTPESLTENSWKLLITPFKLYTWIALLFTLVIGGTAMHVFSLSYKKYMTSRTSVETVGVDFRRRNASTNASTRGLYLFTEPQNGILYTYSMLLLVSLPRLPSAWAVRVFIGWWWIYSILVAVAYRASMTAALANPPSKITIDTLGQLAKSRIAYGGWSVESKDFFLTSSDADSQIIGKKFEITEDGESAIDRIANGTFGYYENAYLLRHIRAKRQDTEKKQAENNTRNDEQSNVKHNLHIMEECAVNMPIAIGMERNSPLKPHVDLWIRRMIEAGLVEKWLSDVMEWSKITEIRQGTETEKALVNLHKLQGALVALGIGYFLSFVAFVGELLHWKYVVLKNPKYDKYHLDVFYGNAEKSKATIRKGLLLN